MKVRLLSCFADYLALRHGKFAFIRSSGLIQIGAPIQEFDESDSQSFICLGRCVVALTGSNNLWSRL